MKIVIDTLGYTIYYGMEAKTREDLGGQFYSYLNHSGDFDAGLIILKDSNPCFGYFASNEENLKKWFENRNLFKILNGEDGRTIGNTEISPEHKLLAKQMAEKDWSTLFDNQEPFVKNLKTVNNSIYNHHITDL